MQRSVYRFNVKDKALIESYLKSAKVYLKSDEIAKSIEDLKEKLIDEGKFSKRNIKSVINGFYKISEDDLLYLKAQDIYAIAKVMEVAQFSNGYLSISADIYKIEKDELPKEISPHFTGVQMQKLNGGLLEPSILLFEKKSEIKPDNLEIKLDNIPAKKEKNEIMKLDDLKISYKKKKKEKIEPSFEMVIEVGNTPQSKSSEPMVNALALYDLPKNPAIGNEFVDIMRTQVELWLRLQQYNMKVMVEMQRLFWESFFKAMENGKI